MTPYEKDWVDFQIDLGKVLYNINQTRYFIMIGLIDEFSIIKRKYANSSAIDAIDSELKIFIRIFSKELAKKKVTKKEHELYASYIRIYALSIAKEVQK